MTSAGSDAIGTIDAWYYFYEALNIAGVWAAVFLGRMVTRISCMLVGKL